MSCKPAPACSAALSEASRLWPKRSRASDGICGDAAHRASVSDHNPARDGYAHAFDLTHDPANGCDAHALIEQLARRRDPRVKYLISQRRIWNPREGWRAYAGTNPHNKHAHVSIFLDATFESYQWWTPITKEQATAMIIEPIGFSDSPLGGGYVWGRRGHVYAFDGAPHFGTWEEHTAGPSNREGRDCIGGVVTQSGSGYWLISDFGEIYAYGDARHPGNYKLDEWGRQLIVGAFLNDRLANSGGVTLVRSDANLYRLPA